MKSSRHLWWAASVAVGICFLTYLGYVVARNRAYAHVEQLTKQYARQVEPFIVQFASEYDLHVVYYKVFEYDELKAKVFVVDKQDPQMGDSAGGTFFYLERASQDSEWELASPPDVVWAFAGSADGCTWPPYRLDGPYADTEY